jgi:lambda family phage portal protein
MGLFTWLFGERKKTEVAKPPPEPKRVVVRPRSSYDAAKSTAETRDWWLNADALSPARANSADVRRVIRFRARHEVANNTYADGIVNTLTNDVIGVGPRLQLQTGDDAGSQRVESSFMAWMKEASAAPKLRTSKTAKTVDGEALLVLITDESLKGPVKLGLRDLEADHLTDPTQGVGKVANASLYDGVEYDAAGNPTFYHISREHPGDGTSLGLKFDRFPASQVIHWFRADRPGQLRGVSELKAALHLFAQLRRYTLAVIAAAETAADFAAVLQSEVPTPADGELLNADPFESLEIERGMMTTMPSGWKMHQFRAEQPTTTYAMFKAEILNEIARCLNMPYNVAACNSSAYNYASGRLDHQTYHKSVRVEQSHCEAVVLNRIFMAWLQEAMFIPGLIPAGMPPFSEWRFNWLWPGWEHVDPLKEANAQAQRLASLTTNLATEYGRQGRDWEAELRQRAKEQQLINDLGLAMESQPAPQQEVEDE